jgi:hypothetical protein
MQKERKGDGQGFGRCGNFSKKREINSDWKKRGKSE